jgi:DNA-binding NarL/FixJ family response regulator
MREDITLYLADDHQIVVDGLQLLISNELGFKVVGAANNGDTAYSELLLKKPDIALIDLRMPGMDGIQLLIRLKKQIQTQFVILSMHKDRRYINDVINNGASGYLLKNTGKKELLDCINKVMNGEKYFPSKTLNLPTSNISLFTPRELEILKLVISENTTQEIASIQIVGDTVKINNTVDEDIIWTDIENHFSTVPDFNDQKSLLKTEIGKAIDDLESKSYSVLRIPKKITKGQKTVTESLVEMLGTQINDYNLALSKCKGDPSTDKNSFNELLRIAYNFSSDALTFVRLIVSICDLKPIILWGTILQHYELSESFKNLPWLRSKRKPSLSNYTSIIGGARNSAFHSLFPFKRSVDIEIPDKSLTQITLKADGSFMLCF